MPEDVKVPKLGKVNKKWVLGAMVVAGGYVAYRWYSAGQAPADTTFETSQVGDTLPTGGAGGVASGNVQYAGSTTDATSADRIDTNAEWTNRAVELLSNAGYEPTTVYSALGDYLANVPLTSAELTIVRAALAAVGNPPVGGPYVMKEQVGEVNLTAPTGLKVSEVTASTATLTFSSVSGAASYSAYDAKSPSIRGTAYSPSIRVVGLAPNTSYTFAVAALTATGKAGPKSSSVTFTTKGVNLSAPAVPSASQISRDRAYLTTSNVTGATTYIWYINGAIKGRTEGPALWATGLKPNTAYKVSVRADAHPQAPGPMSGSRSFRTKK